MNKIIFLLALLFATSCGISGVLGSDRYYKARCYSGGKLIFAHDDIVRIHNGWFKFNDREDVKVHGACVIEKHYR